MPTACGATVVDRLCQDRPAWPAQVFFLPSPGNTSPRLRDCRLQLQLQWELRICRAPNFPIIPGSFGFGLRSRPFFLFKKPSIPLLPLLPSRAITPSSASAGSVKFCSARADQLLSLSSTICTPPLLLEVRDAACSLCGGSGRLNDLGTVAGDDESPCPG